MLKRFTPFFLAALMTLFIGSVLLAFCGYAMAAPTLTTTPYPAVAGQPTAASLTVDGGAAVPCQLARSADGSVTPTCDLAGLAPGTHTLVLTVSNVYACTQSTDGTSAVCYGGGSASSDPFTYSWAVSGASKPRLQFTP